MVERIAINDTETDIKPDDIRQMLVEACEELIDNRKGHSAGDVIVRMISHDGDGKSGGSLDVKKLRLLYGCTQDEMAQAIDVTPATVKSWEQGMRTPKGPSKIVLEAMAIVAARKNSNKKNMEKVHESA